jgi:hypothetical protein
VGFLTHVNVGDQLPHRRWSVTIRLNAPPSSTTS